MLLFLSFFIRVTSKEPYFISELLHQSEENLCNTQLLYLNVQTVCKQPAVTHRKASMSYKVNIIYYSFEFLRMLCCLKVKVKTLWLLLLFATTRSVVKSVNVSVVEIAKRRNRSHRIPP